MVKYSATLDSTFAALADSTRRGILQKLSEGEMAVSALAAPFAMSLPAVMKHLAVLERAGLVRSIKEGRIRRAHVEAAPMRNATRWLERYRIFWESNLDSLARFVESEPAAADESKIGCKQKTEARRRNKKS